MTAENYDNAGLGFDKALDAVKLGHRAFRKNWNGKGLFISLHRGSQPIDNTRDAVQGVSMDLMDVGAEGTTTRLPHIEINYPDGTRCAWLASQTDLLADDWDVYLAHATPE